ncbi:MAG: sulfite exporter TauE/SafE family protein [Limisphaerales bacterium]
MSLLPAIVILAFAGFIQGLTGFGFGLVSMALLPLALPFKEALVVVAALNVAACATTLFATRRHFSWRRGAGVALGSCVGVPIGFYALVHLDSQLLLHALGALMCFFAVSELFLARYFRVKFPEWAGFPVGVVSGSLGGAFNIGGPPVIAYAYSQPWAKEEIVATLQLVFGASAILRLALVGQSGLLHADLLHLALLALLPMLAGIVLGGHLLQRVPREPLKFAVFVFLLTMGAKYLFIT